MMVAYKKFEFDNFIVDDEKDDVIETIDSEQELEVQEEFITTELALEALTEITPPSETIAEQEPVVETVTFSEEEMNAAKIQSEQLGYDKGYQAKSEENETMVIGLLEDINNKLTEMFSMQNKFIGELEQDFMSLNRAVLQKLLPELSDEHATDILNRFLEQNFANFRTEPKLSFFFNPQIATSMQQQIAKLAHIQDFEGKISLHKDDTLGLSDCRIEWENGGVSRSSDKLLEKVYNLLEENTSEN